MIFIRIKTTRLQTMNQTTTLKNTKHDNLENYTTKISGNNPI